jgi:hypothetical protein
MSEYILTHKHHTHPHAASGWRIHCGVEVTGLSTNKQHSLSLEHHPALRAARRTQRLAAQQAPRWRHYRLRQYAPQPPLATLVKGCRAGGGESFLALIARAALAKPWRLKSRSCVGSLKSQLVASQERDLAPCAVGVASLVAGALTRSVPCLQGGLSTWHPWTRRLGLP